jgi:hypothetical protein
MLEATRKRARAQERERTEESSDEFGDDPTAPIMRRTDPDLDADVDADDGYAVAVKTASRITEAWRDD